MRPALALPGRAEVERNLFQCATDVSLSVDVAGLFWTILDFSIVLASRRKSLNVSDFSIFFLVLPDRIELSTSPLPRECSTTELRQRGRHGGAMAGRTCHKGYRGARIAVATDAPCICIRVVLERRERPCS